MSLRRREALVKIARIHDALIITDDVYDTLQWSTPPSMDSPQNPTKVCMPRIVDIDGYLGGGPIDVFGNSVSNGSFSKIVGPGCRTGWAQGTEKLMYAYHRRESASFRCPVIPLLPITDGATEDQLGPEVHRLN